MIENQETQNQTSIFSFSFNEESKGLIKAISQWASIIAILSFIGAGLSIVQFIMATGAADDFAGSRRNFLLKSMSDDNIFTLIIQLAFTLALNILLYNTANFFKKGVSLNDKEMLGKGFETLRIYYKTYGIIIIVVVSLVLLFAVFAGIFGVLNGFR